MTKRDYNSKLLRLENLDVFNNIVKEVASISNMTESGIIEKALYDKYLPVHEDARKWCVGYLYNSDYGIKETLYHVFLYLSCGVDDKARYDNNVKLVEFSAQLCTVHNCIEQDATKVQNLFYAFSDVLRILKKETECSQEMAERYRLANELYDMYSKNPRYMVLHNIYAVILNNWAYLKDFATTYRLLASITDLQTKFIELPGEKRQLCNILVEISNEWVLKDEAFMRTLTRP